jgi:hypothetical protein
MHRVFDALSRLLAPILVYTADEAWNSHSLFISFFIFIFIIPSIHTELSPPPIRPPRRTLEAEIEAWLKLRAVVAQSWNPLASKTHRQRPRSRGDRGNRRPSATRILLTRKDELEEFIILSDLALISGAETKSSLTRTAHANAALLAPPPTVGLNPTHPNYATVARAWSRKPDP